MDKLTNIFSLIQNNKLLFICLSCCVAGLIVYVSLGGLFGAYFNATLPLPKLEETYSCPYNYKIYTLKEAVKNPQNVCGLHIVRSSDLTVLASTSKQFIHIQKLTIEDLEDTELPPEIENLQSLHELYVGDSDGDITIPPEIANLPNLTSFTLSRNGEMTILPVSVAKLTHLSTLVLRYNPKLQIPESLVGQASLTSLSIIGSDLKAIPARVYQLPRLQTLDYSANQITTISGELNMMTSLQQINLRENNLKTFPNISNLTHLQQLDLSHNHLTELPKGIENVKELATLRISHNEIDDRTTDLLQNLTQLISLDLGNNKITQMPKGLEKLQKLQYLRLAGNNLNAADVAKLKSQLPHTTIDF